MVVVAAVAGTGILLAVRKSGTKPDSPVTSTTADSTTGTVTTSADPTVVPAQLNSILLPVEQINAIVGTTGIVVDHSTTAAATPGCSPSF